MINLILKKIIIIIIISVLNTNCQKGQYHWMKGKHCILIYWRVKEMILQGKLIAYTTIYYVEFYTPIISLMHLILIHIFITVKII